MKSEFPRKKAAYKLFSGDVFLQSIPGKKLKYPQTQIIPIRKEVNKLCFP